MGEFQLDEELGRGNYGAVKKVLHKPTNVIMAMKVRFSYISSAPLRITLDTVLMQFPFS